jgi:ribosomal protein S18 acetylase RimI-like enzyme
MTVTTQVDPHPRGLKLRVRALDPDKDGYLFGGVRFGDEPWHMEIEEHFRKKARDFEHRKVCFTTLFLHPEREEVIGFYSIQSHTLELTDKFREEFEMSKRKAPGMNLRVEVCYLMAFGVNVEWEGKGYGKQMYLNLVDALVNGEWRPPFIFLKVWRDNWQGAYFWDHMEFQNFDEETATLSTDHDEPKPQRIRLLMAAKIRD